MHQHHTFLIHLNVCLSILVSYINKLKIIIMMITLMVLKVMIMIIMVNVCTIAQIRHHVKVTFIQQTQNLLLTFEHKWELVVWKTNYINFPVVSFLIVCRPCDHLHNHYTYNTYVVWSCMAHLATARHSLHVDLPSYLDHALVWPF